MANITILSDQILIQKINAPDIAGEFINIVQECLIQKKNRPKLIFNEGTAVYPNAACPLAGLISYYKKDKVKFQINNLPNSIQSTCITSPIRVEPNADSLKRNVLNKVWEFKDSDEVFAITQAYINELSQIDTFEQGALLSLEWSLYETMDNVINHAKTDSGFVMGQIHPKSKHIAFCIFDTGQGIFNSLQSYKPSPKTPLDALTLCVKAEVTRDKSVGQGNGLFGLYQIVAQNSGRLSVSSAGASFIFEEGLLESIQNIPTISPATGCTSVDFQLDYSKPISLSEALNINGKQFKPVNHRIEALEDTVGEIVYKVKEKSAGFGTRKAGLRVRNEVINIYKETNQTISIDFEGISVIASSFADEFIGKLVLEFGFFGFNNIIRLKNMNELTQSIVQRSVSQRMAESL